MSKPLEFWVSEIDFADNYGGYKKTWATPRGSDSTVIHVIEFSALEAEQARSAKLLEAVEKYLLSRKVVAKELDWDSYESLEKVTAAYHASRDEGENG